MANNQEVIDFLKSLNAAGINSREQFISAMQPSGMLTTGGTAPAPKPNLIPEENRNILQYLVNQGFDKQGIEQLNLDSRGLLDFRDFTPTGERYSNAQNDAAAQAFYQFIHDNPDYYDHLNPTEQSQYQYLRYVNGEISGNNKDDQIKKVRQAAGLPQDQYDGEARYIWRNKPIRADRNDGITAGDAFGIGAYSQRDTGNDGGLLGHTLTNVANASLPGFSVADVMDPLAPIVNPVVDAFNSPVGTAALTGANLLGGLGMLGQGGLQGLAAANAANIGSNVAQGGQSDPVGEAENGPVIGATPVGTRPGWHWERNTRPDAVGEWIAVKDKPTNNTGGSPSTGSTGGGGTPSGGQKPGGSTTPDRGEQDKEDIWIWNGSVLVNTSTGATQEVPNSGKMETGATYNGDGDKIGDPQNPDEGQLVLGGYVPDFGELDDDVFGDTTAGDTTDPGSGGEGDGNGGLSTGGPPPGSGGDVPDWYPDTDGDGLPGPGPGPYGGGDGDGEGDGDGDGVGPGVAGIGGGLLGGGGDQEYKDFMSGINYLFQNLDRLQISSTDYLGMLIGSLQNDVPGNS